MDVPAFVELDGELKNRFGVVGLSLLGANGRPEDYTGDTILQAVITPETRFFCGRR